MEYSRWLNDPSTTPDMRAAYLRLMERQKKPTGLLNVMSEPATEPKGLLAQYAGEKQEAIERSLGQGEWGGLLEEFQRFFTKGRNKWAE